MGNIICMTTSYLLPIYYLDSLVKELVCRRTEDTSGISRTSKEGNTFLTILDRDSANNCQPFWPTPMYQSSAWS